MGMMYDDGTSAGGIARSKERKLHTLIVPTEQECSTCDGKGTVLAYDGQRLRDVRERTDISLRTMAKSIGISAAYLSDLERGNRGVSEKVATAFQEEIRKWEGNTATSNNR